MPRGRLAVCLAAAAALAIPGLAAGKPDEPVPGRVQVRGVEFDLTLSRQKVRPGRVIVQFLNEGEDPHDLRLKRLGVGGEPDGTEFGTGELGPGAYENIDSQLKKRSTYLLWCSIQDHRQLGMEATLRTKKRKRPN